MGVHMIHSLLLCLKIIGIVLGIAVAIVLFLLLAILFIPIRYKAEASYEKEELRASAKIYWFLSIVHVIIYYEENANYVIRIFGIPVYNDLKVQKRKQKRQKKTKKNVTNKVNKNNEPDNSVKNRTINEQLPKESISAESLTKTAEIEECRFLIQKIKELLQKIILAFQNIKYTIEKIYDKIKNICNNIKYYYELFQSKKAKNAYGLCKKQIKELWKNIRPKKYQLFLHIGNEDPAFTGQIMAVYGMLYPFYTNHVTILPDFEENIIEGKVYVKGRITVFIVIKVMWCIYFDKNLRRFLSLLKKEE